jgi:hypothetical protein
MTPRLPPPDPHESYDLALTGGYRAAAPTALFVQGQVTPETDRIADRILDMRPGVLVVVARG